MDSPFYFVEPTLLRALVCSVHLPNELLSSNMKSVVFSIRLPNCPSAKHCALYDGFEDYLSVLILSCPSLACCFNVYIVTNIKTTDFFGTLWKDRLWAKGKLILISIFLNTASFFFFNLTSMCNFPIKLSVQIS